MKIGHSSLIKISILKISGMTFERATGTHTFICEIEQSEVEAITATDTQKKVYIVYKHSIKNLKRNSFKKRTFHFMTISYFASASPTR